MRPMMKSIFILFTALEIAHSEICRSSLPGPSGTAYFPPQKRPTQVPQFALRGDNATTDCFYFRNTFMKAFVMKFRNASLDESGAQIKSIKRNPNAKWKAFRKISGKLREKVITIRGVKYVKIVVKKNAGFFTLDYQVQTPPVLQCRIPREPVKVVKCSKGQKLGSKCSFTCLEGFSVNHFLDTTTASNFIATCKKVNRKSAVWRPVLNKDFCGQGRRIKKECRKRFEFCKQATKPPKPNVPTILTKQPTTSSLYPVAASLPNQRPKRKRMGYFRRRQNSVKTYTTTTTTPKTFTTKTISQSSFSTTAKSSSSARPKRRRMPRRRKIRLTATTTVKPRAISTVVTSHTTHSEIFENIDSADTTISTRNQSLGPTDDYNSTRKYNSTKEAQSFTTTVNPLIQKSEAPEASTGGTPESGQEPITTSPSTVFVDGGTIPPRSLPEPQPTTADIKVPSTSETESKSFNAFNLSTQQPELMLAPTNNPAVSPEHSFTNDTAMRTSQPNVKLTTANKESLSTAGPMPKFANIDTLHLGSQPELTPMPTNNSPLSVARSDAWPITATNKLLIPNPQPESKPFSNLKSSTQSHPYFAQTNGLLTWTSKPVVTPAPPNNLLLSTSQPMHESYVNSDAPVSERTSTRPTTTIKLVTETTASTTTVSVPIYSPKTNPTTTTKAPTTTTARTKVTSPESKRSKGSMVSIGRTTTTIAYPIVFSGAHFVFIRPMVATRSTTIKPSTQSATPTSISWGAVKVQHPKVRASPQLNPKTCKIFCKMQTSTMKYTKLCSDFRVPGKKKFCILCRYSPTKPCKRYLRLL